MYEAYVRNAYIAYKRTETAYGRDFKGITAGTFFFLLFFSGAHSTVNHSRARAGRIAEEYYISRRALAAIPRALTSPPARVRLPPHPTPAAAVPGPGPETNVFRIKPPPPPPPHIGPCRICRYRKILHIHTHAEGSRETATAHTPI